ncbi:MAG: family 16 glycosylhydrolase [Bacteroidales bacterium]|nr:family 16 glycosylhydrolase [Bacteroidales bacterium]
MKASIFNSSKKFRIPGKQEAVLVIGLLLISAMFVGCEKKNDTPDFSPNFTYSQVDENHIRFSNTSDGEYYSLIWNFGNGTADTTTDRNKSYVIYYPVSGNFNVSLKIVNYYGESKSSNKSVAINNSDLVISFTMEPDPSHPNYITLTNTSQGNYDSLVWNYRNEEIKDVLEHIAYFPYAGDYDISLTLFTNNKGYSATETISIAQDDPELPTGLVWAEEFDYTGLPDIDNWTIETGGNGWGNQELQYYTDSENNLYVDNGVLTITAREESVGGRDYTSGRIKTENKFDFQYGRIEARIKMPYGQGMWAAFWMLGANNSTVGWPECGEIDIVEMVGGTNNDNTCHSTLHWDNAGENAQYGQSYSLTSGILADDFHVYSVEWTEQKITAFIDGTQYFEIDITPAELSEFHNNFFIILNLAVGGTWPGSPDNSTVFPQSMEVDYVRVYQLEE